MKLVYVPVQFFLAPGGRDAYDCASLIFNVPRLQNERNTRLGVGPGNIHEIWLLHGTGF